VQLWTCASLAIPVSQAVFGSAQCNNLNRNFPLRGRFSDVH
jgi:hypothetical protein